MVPNAYGGSSAPGHQADDPPVVPAGDEVAGAQPAGLEVADAGEVQGGDGSPLSNLDDRERVRDVVPDQDPLTLPPDYNLRPPDPGAVRPQETTVQDRVKSALYGSVGDAASGPATVGENALLTRAGATESMPDIRKIINQDNAIYAEDNEGFVDSLIFWRDDEALGVIVDPTKENQRLQEAEALGETPTGSDTVVIEKREEGFLEGLF